MRIWHLIADTTSRGSQAFAVVLAEAQRAAGHDAKVSALTTGEGATLDVHVLHLSGTGPLAVWGLRSDLRRHDVVVAHGPVAGEVVAKAAGRSGRFVYRHVRDSRGWTPRPPRPRSTPAYLQRAAAVVALSPGARADLIDFYGLPAPRVHSIPIAVNAGKFPVPTPAERAAAREQLELADQTMAVMFVGELTAGCGVDLVIRALVDTDHISLVVVGDGPERTRLELLAEGLVPGRVVFAGSARDVTRPLAAADVLVRPSVWGDSMPRPVIESGLCGVPAVVSSIGSMPEMMHDGESGVVVPAGDVKALRAALLSLRMAPEERRGLGSVAREVYLKRFDIEVVERAWSELLEQLGPG